MIAPENILTQDSCKFEIIMDYDVKVNFTIYMATLLFGGQNARSG